VDFSELVPKAVRFQKEISTLQRTLPRSGFDWYPYDSIGSLIALDQLLTGASRDLVALAAGRPVLDIGCGDGHIAFFLESLGCRVTAIDNPNTNYNQMQGVRALKAALKSNVEILEQDIDYDFNVPGDNYGLTLLLGLLYHVKGPFQLLETLSRISEHCILNTRVARFAADRKTRIDDLPVAYLVGADETNFDHTNYWVFSSAGLKRLCERSGWTVCDFRSAGNTSSSDPASWQGDERAMCRLTRTRKPITNGRLLDGWYEAEGLSEWRWTEKQFSVSFDAGGDSVKMSFYWPPVVAEGAGAPLTVTMSIGGEAVRSLEYREPGDHVFEAALAGGEPAVVTFSVDRWLKEGQSDGRELGLIVSGVNRLGARHVH
jgi:SAM-dependent methyltransferase